MSEARERTCAECGVIDFTASKATVCAKCHTEARRKAKRQEEKEYIESLGYTNVEYVGFSSHLKPQWRFTHECGARQTWVYGNIVKRVKAEPGMMPCSKCGGSRRQAVAMEAYIAKYGISEEELAKLTRYTKKVRGMTDTTYKLYEAEINPLKLKRGQGPDDYHLDHILSIYEGFKQGLPPEFIARKENLQMLKSKENLSKGRK